MSQSLYDENESSIKHKKKIIVSHTHTHTIHSPDQSLHSKSDHCGEQEERGDQDVEQGQSSKGLRGRRTSFIDEVMHHKRLRERI